MSSLLDEEYGEVLEEVDILLDQIIDDIEEECELGMIEESSDGRIRKYWLENRETEETTYFWVEREKIKLKASYQQKEAVSLKFASETHLKVYDKILDNFKEKTPPSNEYEGLTPEETAFVYSSH